MIPSSCECKVKCNFEYSEACSSVITFWRLKTGCLHEKQMMTRAVGGWCAASVSALLTKGHQPRSVADRWRPPYGAGPRCDLQSLYLTRERLIITSKLTGPGRRGRFLTDIAIPHSTSCQRSLLLTLGCQAYWAPCLLSAAPSYAFFYFDNHHFCFAGTPLTPGWAYGPTMVVKIKGKLTVEQNSLIFFIVDTFL